MKGRRYSEHRLAKLQMIKRLTRMAAMIGAVIVSMTLAPEPAFADKRVALVVGNSSYQTVPQLPNPSRDASAVAKLLRDAGFDIVDIQLNVENLEFKRAIRKFEAEADQADIAVVYYAGHGLEIAGTNYLIPVDARLASDRDADDEAISLERLVSSADGARRLRLVILDACRDNPFVGTMRRERKTASRAVASGLGRVEPTSTDTLIAYAAKAGSTAADGDGEHSPFTAAILKTLTVPGLDVRLAFGRVRDEVLKETSNLQEPFVYGSLGGGNVSLVPAPVVPQEAPLGDIKADYELVQQINTKRAWEVFLGTHPTGFYADLAKARIEQLNAQPASQPNATVASLAPQQPPATPESPSKEAIAWDKVKDSTEIPVLQRFIKRFPNAPLALTAKQRIDVLKKAAQEREEKARAEREAARQAAEEARRKAEQQKAELAAQKKREEDERRAREAEAAEKARAAAAELAAKKRREEEERQAAAAEAARQAKAAEAERKAQETKQKAEKAEREKAAAEAAARAAAEQKAKEAEAAEKARAAAVEAARQAKAAAAERKAQLAKQKTEQAEREKAAAEAATRAAAEQKAKEAEAAEKARAAAAEAARQAKAAEDERKVQEAKRKAEQVEQEKKAAAEAAARAAAEKQAKEAEAARKKAELAAAKEATCKDEQSKLDAIISKGSEGAGVDDLKQFSRTVTCERLAPVVVAAIDRFNAEAAKRAAARPDSPELVRSAQSQLVRLGCLSAKADGKLDDKTMSALSRYLKIEGQPADNPSVTEALVTELSKHATRVCPVQCDQGQTLKGETCVADHKPEAAPATASGKSNGGEDTARRRQQATGEQAQPRRPKSAPEAPRARAQALARPSIVGGGGSGHTLIGVGF